MRIGTPHTKEWKENMSKRVSGKNNPMYGRSGKDNPRYGKTHTLEARKKISEAHKDKPTWNKGLTKETDERVMKYSKSLIGRYVSEETRLKRSGKNSSRYGKKHSLESIKKMSKAKKGKHNSEEHNKNIRKANIGKYVSLETRKRISESNKGRIISIKTRRKISKAHKGENNFFYGKTHTSESRKKISASHQGIPLSQWEKFTSFEPYTPKFNKQFKRVIRKRDNHCCVICDKPKEESNKLLSIHHIDYNKKNSFPQNCVSLCNNCHLKTNKNRKALTVFFQKLLKERYGYQYTQDQKIILDFKGS